MSAILRIVIGLVIAVVGTFFVIKTTTVLDTFGTVEWAESKLGGGGSRLFYKLLGILFIFIGFIVMTNLWNAFLEATIGSLLPTPQP